MKASNPKVGSPISGVPLSNADLQKIYDSAKRMWLSSHNQNYEPHLWTTFCYITAYCRLYGLPAPVAENRDPSIHVAADD